jgi:hypothetical protein
MSQLSDYKRCVSDPHEEALREQIKELRKRTAALEEAVRWALGEDVPGPEFRAREPGEGAYWWRIELRRRAFPPAEAVATT